MAKPPDGLPVYGNEGLLELAGLATVTMLRRHRRQPSWTQQPVACYWTGHDYALLYRADQAVAMAPLSPGRQRLYDTARTCAACGARKLDPLERGRDGKRYCEPCQGPAAERLWLAERAADRAAAAAWAYGVLDNADDAVLVGASRERQYWREIYVTDLAGRLLIEANVRWYARDPEVVTEHPERFVGSVSPRDIVDRVAALAGRRMIAWQFHTDPQLSVSFDDHGNPVEPGPRMAEGDVFGRWYDRWVGQLASGASYRWNPVLAHQSRPHDPSEQTARMRELLGEMAAGVEASSA